MTALRTNEEVRRTLWARRAPL